MRNRLTVLIAVVGAVLLLGGATIATAATTTRSGTSVTRVAVVTQDTAATYSGAVYANVATVSVYALAGQWIDARYTAESSCYGTAGAWCHIRILIDGAEAGPSVGTDFAFNSVNSGGGSSGWASHSVERYRAVTTSGTHTVVVQARSVGSATHRLDDSTLFAYVITP